jgi:cytochrome c oxidase assembly protein subunit 15
VKKDGGGPRRLEKSGEEIFNPVVFNKKAELYVVSGKERVVGGWLGLVSGSIFLMVLVGGYTRLTKSGLSMVRWEPHRILPPMNKEEWEKEFEEYKKSPEWIHLNSKKGMDLQGFKYIFFWEWAHRLLGRSIGALFLLPLSYFWMRGYL